MTVCTAYQPSKLCLWFPLKAKNQPMKSTEIHYTAGNQCSSIHLVWRQQGMLPQAITLFLGWSFHCYLCHHTCSLHHVPTCSCMPFMFISFSYHRPSDTGVHGSIACGDTALLAGTLRIQLLMRSLRFLNDLILPAYLWPWDQLSLYM
jgi:hypothetical protein